MWREIEQRLSAFTDVTYSACVGASKEKVPLIMTEDIRLQYCVGVRFLFVCFQ